MTTYCQVLTPNRLRKKGLRSWNGAFPKENGHYQALYPQSWTTYDLPGQNVRLLCKQLSPVIPHDYQVLFDFYLLINDENKCEENCRSF
jgi:non-lysosomal glucosylceramidase